MYTWSLLPFYSLTALQVYRIMQVRSEVFVVEQNCVYPDADNKDLKAFHLMCWDGDTLAAYTRLLPPGISYKEMSIGRVLTHSQYRKEGLGKKLMEQSIIQCRELFGEGEIVIGAQLYLKRFYESFGFIQEGDIYLEDNIEHIIMRLH